MDNRTEIKLQEAITYLEAGNPVRASNILTSAYEEELGSWEITFSLDCCNYWRNNVNQISLYESPFEKGESLLIGWKSFIDFVKNEPAKYDKTLRAIQRGNFSLALQNFHLLLNEKNPVQRAEILRKVGLCYKKLGEYDNAKMCLTEANNCHQGQAAVLADFADCHALCGNDKAAKILFREAFFSDYKKIDLDFLDSELIVQLIESTKSLGYNGDLLKAWIPVYGVLWGVFNIKRALRPQELGRLRQDIYALENASKDPSRVTEETVPRLINMYFWLIDYCQGVNDNRLISELLLKIKILDTNIYNMYVK